MELSDFPQNKYANHYIRLIKTRKNQKREKYKTESHHIFPVSIFGKNKETVNLTHKEHFIAHLFLWKMYQKEFGNEYFATKKMAKCFIFINRKKHNTELKITSRIFQNLREQFRIINSEQTLRLHEEGIFEDNLKWLVNYWENEENRKAQSKRRKEWHSIPENKEKVKQTNKKLTNTLEWREQRRLKQIEFSSDPEYTKKRIYAMNKPEIKEKVALTQKMNAAAMTKEQRSAKFGRYRTEEQILNHADKIRGRKKYFNLILLKIKISDACPGQDWKLRSELTDEEYRLFPRKIFDSGIGSRGSKWVYNNVTLERKKIKPNEELPENYSYGKGPKKE